jgi:hypothetical protein
MQQYLLEVELFPRRLWEVVSASIIKVSVLQNSHESLPSHAFIGAMKVNGKSGRDDLQFITQSLLPFALTM